MQGAKQEKSERQIYAGVFPCATLQGLYRAIFTLDSTWERWLDFKPMLSFNGEGMHLEKTHFILQQLKRTMLLQQNIARRLLLVLPLQVQTHLPLTNPVTNRHTVFCQLDRIFSRQISKLVVRFVPFKLSENHIAKSSYNLQLQQRIRKRGLSKTHHLHTMLPGCK